MQRIPEPELMDEPCQVQAYAAADFDRSDQAMVDQMAERCGGDGGDRVVDLGCGPGNITFRLAHRWPDADVLGIDGAARMVAIARQRLANEGLQTRLRFEQALLPLPPDHAWSGTCSAVVSNSLLHHLHNPQVLWQAVHQLAADHGWVYVQDLRRPSSPAAVDLLVDQEMADAPDVLRRDYRASLHAAFTPAEVKTQLQQAGLSGLTVEAHQDRYLVVWGRVSSFDRTSPGLTRG
jgi:trans-aconitate 2-methyltransferase